MSEDSIFEGEAGAMTICFIIGGVIGAIMGFNVGGLGGAIVGIIFGGFIIGSLLLWLAYYGPCIIIGIIIIAILLGFIWLIIKLWGVGN